MLELPLVGAVPPYWIGVLASLMVELFAAAKASNELGGAIPPRYKKPFYLTSRVLVALSSGVSPRGVPSALRLRRFLCGRKRAPRHGAAGARRAA
ncbi:MAG TPA: hypothetical protein VGD66_03765 [Allosphingosinicella sp.]|jgi:hypothetical protein